MKPHTRIILVLLAGLVIGFVQNTLPATRVAAASTPASGSAQPMPMGSGMQTKQAQCGGMHMMATHSQADKALVAAMMAMHRSMMGMNMTGDADHDFLVMMIPHHRAAVEMAQTVLRYGKDARVRALAAKIIKTQQAEIDEMQQWLHAKT